MKRSLKSVAAGQLDVADLAHDRARLGALAHAQRRDLRPLPRHVPRRHDARQRHPRHEPDPHGARGREVGAERPGEQHLGDVVGAPRPSSPSRICQPVAIEAFANWSSRTSRWVRKTAVGRVRAARGQDEDPLLADLRQPRGELRRDEAAASSGTKRPEWSSSPARTSSATQSTSPEPHIPIGGDVADHLERDRVVLDLHALDRALRRAHAAADLGRLEGRAGGRRGGHHALVVAQRDLASSCRRR